MSGDGGDDDQRRDLFLIQV